MDLALNNQQWLICHKTKPNQTHTHTHTLSHILYCIILYYILVWKKGSNEDPSVKIEISYGFLNNYSTSRRPKNAFLLKPLIWLSSTKKFYIFSFSALIET